MIIENLYFYDGLTNGMGCGVILVMPLGEELMKIYKIFLVVFLLFVSVYQHLAVAEDKISQKEIKSNKSESSWEAAKQKLEILKDGELSEEEECQLMWDTLWTWSKKGELEARASLFMLTFPSASDVSVLFMPGSGDELSRRRNSIALAIYSTGTHQKYFQKISNMAFQMYLNDGFEGSSFLKCLKEQSREVCAQGAQGGLVPTFDVYAAEIDALIEQGMKPKCKIQHVPKQETENAR
ncbi:MAG: hypothetical protein PHX61_11705 [Alphaproteobacteria bacterium]|nr:hypothetical protein [Alphaproteobacteria bacterium]